MSSLKDLQESFQRGILAGDDTILAEIKDSAKEERKALFGVYRHAYVARLAEVLGDRPGAQLPAQLIMPVKGTLEWLIDQAAASLLSLPLAPDKTQQPENNNKN